MAYRTLVEETKMQLLRCGRSEFMQKPQIMRIANTSGSRVVFIQWPFVKRIRMRLN